MNISIKDSSLWHFVGKIRRKWHKIKRDRIKKKKIANFNTEAESLLHHIASVFNENRIVFWFEFGSLLGYYRENDFLKHDDDIDLGARLEDAPFIRKVLLDSGFELIRYYNDLRGSGFEECYRCKGFHTTFDIFYFDFTEKGAICCVFRAIHNMRKKKNLCKELPFAILEMVFPTFTPTKATFKGVDIYIPDNCKEHLAAYYGPGFMTPDPKFDNRESGNVTWHSYEARPAIGWMKYGYDDLI